MTLAFIDINLGDPAEAATGSTAWDRTNVYLKEAQARYGIGLEATDASKLNEDDREALCDYYATDPRAAEGALVFARPPPLLAGRLLIRINDDDAPKAVANFVALLRGDRGVGKASGKPLCYVGVRFHRIVRDFCCQGGDIVKGNGSGGDSIYGGRFNDEKGGLALKHDRAGVVSMANAGKNTNQSQFFFTLGPAPQCDGKHVVLGRVENAEGLALLERINREAATPGGEPACPVSIAACGVLA